MGKRKEVSNNITESAKQVSKCVLCSVHKRSKRTSLLVLHVIKYQTREVAHLLRVVKHTEDLKTRIETSD